ncbi:MAG: hypothetical protein ACRD4Y_10065, partial [Candidatus Acidiferrales bacterium]
MTHHIFNVFFLLGLAGLSSVGMSLHSQVDNGISVDIEDHGSAPPVSDWYSCVRELEKQPSYDPAQGNRCLKQILSHGQYFKSGRIRFAPSTRVSKLVVFVLESPSLKLTTIDYGIRKELKSEFQDYVGANNLFPLVGATYDFRDESSNESRIGNFFASKGIMVGVSKRVNLDYRAGTASLSYRIWEGPDGPVRPLLTACDVRLTYFSLLDLDDFTPMNLILKSTRTRDGECFSESAIRLDEQTLRNMGIFSEVNYTVGAGNGSGQGVSVHARTKPLEVSSISIDGFGLASTEGLQKELGKLPM